MAKVSFDIRAIEKWVGKSKKRMVQTAQESTAEAGARVIERTPVDTAFARNNWFPTLNGQFTAGGGGAVVASVSFSGMKLGDRLGLVNNTEYIVPLEYGASGQAPEGMVRVTAAEWPVIVREVAMRIGRG